MLSMVGEFQRPLPAPEVVLIGLLVGSYSACGWGCVIRGSGLAVSGVEGLVPDLL